MHVHVSVCFRGEINLKKCFENDSQKKCMIG